MLYSRIEGKGKPLLILHGYLGMSDNWKTLSGKFAEAGFQVHALDLRNHGRSFHSEEFSHELMMQDILQYCKFHNLKKISLIGHSMGGKLAMFLAVTHPDLIDKLIIADISVREYSPHHQDILEALNSVDFSIHTDRKQVEQVIAQYVPDFGTCQFLLKNVYRITPNQLGFRMNLKSLTENYNNMGIEIPKSSKYDKSVLFLRGEKSNYIRERDEQDILNIFPKAEIKTVSKAGHWLHAENPEEFLKYALDYLK
ncbi:MAG: alpha/beta fold hydrolase [Flavobacteriaceae bacterium]